MNGKATVDEYVNRTYRLSPEAADGIKALAQQHELWDSSLVDFLIRHGLKAVAAGKLAIRRRPVAYVIDDGAE